MLNIVVICESKLIDVSDKDVSASFIQTLSDTLGNLKIMFKRCFTLVVLNFFFSFNPKKLVCSHQQAKKKISMLNEHNSSHIFCC